MHSKPAQGTKGTGKSVEPEAALGKPGMYPAGIKSHGLAQAPSHVTRDTESNHETLRHGSKPKPESVQQAEHDKSARARAHKFNERSISGGANPTAASQGVNE